MRSNRRCHRGQPVPLAAVAPASAPAVNPPAAITVQAPVAGAAGNRRQQEAPEGATALTPAPDAADGAGTPAAGRAGRCAARKPGAGHGRERGPCHCRPSWYDGQSQAGRHPRPGILADARKHHFQHRQGHRVVGGFRCRTERRCDRTRVHARRPGDRRQFLKCSAQASSPLSTLTLESSECASFSSTQATSRSASPSSRRAGCTCSRRPRRRASAIPSSATKRSRPSTRSRCSRRRRRHRHPHRQRAARLRGRARRARARRLGRLRRHPRHALSGRGARARRRARGRQGRRRRASGPRCVDDCVAGAPQRVYDGGRIAGDHVHAGALGPAAEGPLHVGVGADRARLPEALLVLLGVAHRRPGAAAARRRRAWSARSSSCGAAGFRFIALADDNFYPGHARGSAHGRGAAPTRRGSHELEAIRAERFELMEQLAQLPDDIGVLHADHDGSGRGSGVPRRDEARAHQGRARRRRVGDPEGLKDVYKGFNLARRRAGRAAAGVPQARRPRARLVHLRPAERPAGRPSTRPLALAEQADVTFAQFVMLTPFPGHARFREVGEATWATDADASRRHADHAALADSAGAAAEGLHAAPDDGADEIRARTQGVWDEFYSCRSIWARSRVVQVAEGAAGVRADLEAVPADVREHRHRHRQRAARRSVRSGTDHREGLPPAVHRGAHARSASAAGRRVVARVADGVSPSHRPGWGRASRAGAAALTRPWCPAQPRSQCPASPGQPPTTAHLRRNRRQRAGEPRVRRYDDDVTAAHGVNRRYPQTVRRFASSRGFRLPLRSRRWA